MIPGLKDVILHDAQYSMIELYLNDVVVKELKLIMSNFTCRFEGAVIRQLPL